MNEIFLYSTTASVLAIGVMIILILNTIRKLLETTEKRKEREYYSSLDITDEKLSLLDRLVNIEFENYVKIHPDKFDLTGESYIKESEFHNIITDITARICMRITPAIEENIKLVYQYEDQERLIKIIGEKVGLTLAIAASEVNSSLLDDSAFNIQNTSLDL